MDTLIISTSWSTPLSPGKRGYKRWRRKISMKQSIFMAFFCLNKRSWTPLEIQPDQEAIQLRHNPQMSIALVYSVTLISANHSFHPPNTHRRWIKVHKRITVTLISAKEEVLLLAINSKQQLLHHDHNKQMTQNLTSCQISTTAVNIVIFNNITTAENLSF